MASFMRRFIPWNRDDQQYEPLPLSNDDVPAAEYAKESEPVVVEPRFKWLQATTPNAQWIWALMPFIIARPLGKTDRTLPKTTSTTYLNGVRGLACWVVFNHHMTMEIYRPWVFNAFGAEEPGMNIYFFQMPIVRVLHTGKGMVCLFFALSGFVLSYSSLRKINGAPSEKVADEILTGLSSALLRRGIRLFTPMIVLAFITALLTYYMPWGEMDHQAPTFFAHLDKFYLSCVEVMNPYYWELTEMPFHFPHAWTLAQEYRLSLALFLMLIATCKLPPIARKMLIVVVAIWSMYCDRRWDVLGFMGGYLVAELRFVPLCRDIGRLIGRPNLQMNSWMSMILGAIAVVVGLILCSWPEAGSAETVQPYKFFWKLAPMSWRGKTETELSGAYIWYFGSIGAVLLLWGIEQLPILQRALSCTALNYLGEISYAFYLVHRDFKVFVFLPLFHQLTEKLEWSKTSGFMVAYAIALVLVIIAADYFWRVVDEKSVKLARFIVADVLGVGAKTVKQVDTLLPSPPMQQAVAGRTATSDE